MTGRLIFETRVTPWFDVERLPAWRDSTVAAYRIWVRRTAFGWLQRHEWRHRDANDTRKDDWIVGPKGFPPSSQPPEPGL